MRSQIEGRIVIGKADKETNLPGDVAASLLDLESDYLLRLGRNGAKEVPRLELNKEYQMLELSSLFFCQPRDFRLKESLREDRTDGRGR